MNWVRDINKELNSDRIRFKDVVSEVKELVSSRTITDFKEELSDVLYFLYSWIHQRTGINMPMLGAGPSIIKFRRRISVWETIFAQNGLEFDTKYLINGSNHNKPEKVRRAIELAKHEQLSAAHPGEGE